MTDTVVEALIFELLRWLAQRERGYEEVMDAWRSAVDTHARRRLRRWLCAKHNEPRPAYKRFPEASPHSVYGLVQLPHRTANLPGAPA
jgi:RNA-directed DNA polymerase